MFRIGEFSRLTQVTVRMLRYYDETGLLRPARVDPRTGYRLYETRQIPRLNQIIYLRDSGFNVAEIAAALDAEEKGLLAKQLDRKSAEIGAEIEACREKLRKLETARRALLNGGGGIHFDISVKPVAECLALSLRRTIPDYYGEGLLWKELAGFAGQRRIALTGEPFSIYHDPDYREKQVDVELCVPIKESVADRDGFTCRTVEAVPFMASTMVCGDFPNIAGAFQAFARWLQDNEVYRMAGLTRQIVHRGPWNEDDPDHYLTELQIPLEMA
ncbi:MerR family transcriptional regulator [Enterocloster lavalensis]|uniref:MerR family transcriptional regulator n=1 Tax=Enterocloster lavalensis TaxID=460384 RepID=UPI001D08600F|nr:MerR family transcriptional regulator [Enterocloster lavalensis]MCB6342320.1 MerR family transcriptional regulator [Enterocloster lavalensis]